MFFLVFFEFSSLDVDQFDLAVKVFLNSFVLFYLFVKAAFFLVDSLFFLTDTVFAVIDLSVAVIYFPVMGRLHLYELFFGFQFFLFLDGFCPEFRFF